MKNDLDIILDSLIKEFSSDVGSIHQLGPDNTLHMVAHSKNIPPHLVEATMHIPLGKGIAGNTAKNQVPTVIKNLSGQTPKFVMPLAKTVGLGGCLCLPLFSDGKVVGTISLGCNDEREYTQKEIEHLKELLDEQGVINMLAAEPLS